MKQGWKYRKLSEVCVFRRGLTYSKDDEALLSSNMVLRSNNIDLDSMKLDLTEIKYLKDDFNIPSEKKLQGGSVLLCMSNGSKQHVGKVAYIERDMDYAFGGFMGLIVPLDSLFPKFVYYVCRSSLWRDFMRNIGKGIGITNLRFSELGNFSIPVPSIEEQEVICSELDKLSLVIEKKKEQLKELDNLAQSIFYDMFGDPFTNEKGWDVKTIKDSCKRLYAGGDVPKDRFCKEKNTDYTIPIFSNGTENNGLYGYTDEPRETENCITIAGRGTIGYCVIRREPFFPIIRLIVAVPKDEINVVYLKGVIDCLKLKGQGVAIPQLTIPMIKDNIIPVPPLSLQQSFAEKIETIEHQKELINQSIQEVQTLFDSRMDYYFGD